MGETIAQEPMTMPVSKKRKKDGKPVHRKQPAAPEATSEAHPPEGGAPGPQTRMGKPTNPFVSAQPQHRGAQRGR
jgi:hypothetical protein